MEMVGGMVVDKAEVRVQQVGLVVGGDGPGDLVEEEVRAELGNTI